MLYPQICPSGICQFYMGLEEPGPTRGNLLTITREGLFGFFQDTLIEQIDQDTGDGSGGYVAGNGLSTTHQYAPDGSITAIDIDRVMSLEYQFDESGRIIGIDVNGTLRRYGYSRLGLTLAEQNSATFRFEYDGIGNRAVSSVERDDGSVSATRYDYPQRGEGNRLLGGTTYSADQNAAGTTNGKTTERIDSQRFNPGGAPDYTHSGYRYEYNSAQRPIKVFDNDTLLAEYAYNGFGERIKKVVYRGDQKRVTYYLYDGHRLTAEVDGDSETFKQGVFLDDAPVAYLIGRDAYAVHADHLGTPQMVTDSEGEVVWSADYDPFGKATITTLASNSEGADSTTASSTSTIRISASAIELPYRLPGQYYDAETGTHYNYLRDYDPVTGRYITSDPIGLQGGINTYAYALNNPLSLTDPLGLNPDGQTNTTGESPDKPSAEDISEESYTAKLSEVLGYAIEELKSTDASAAAIGFLNDMKENVAIVAGVVAALAAAHLAGVGFVADVVLGAAGFILAGYAGGKFLYDTIILMMDLKDTRLCEEDELKSIGERFAGSVKDLGTALAESIAFGALGRISGAIKDAADYASDGAFTLLRRLRERFRNEPTIARICSFDGDTLVVTEEGYKPIRDIRANKDRVLAKDERSGDLGWKDVLAQYSNQYEETVHVTASDASGRVQTIISNRIHPYFARIAASALIATASVVSNPAIATEGHVYAGSIQGGAWVDAQYLKPGDELLGENDQWQVVESVVVEDAPLEAFNLTVDDYSTYFVAGGEDAKAVWVHNKCFDDLPPNYRLLKDPTDYDQPRYVDRDGNELYMGHDGRYYDPSVKGQEPTPHPEGVARQSLDDILVDGNVPINRGTRFVDWFDNLTPAQLDRLWVNSDPNYRSIIEQRIRGSNDGMHEWCMVCRAPTFKRWGVSMSYIKAFRVKTTELTWKIPNGYPDVGQSGGHGALGSGRFHNELKAIIDSIDASNMSVAEFNALLVKLGRDWNVSPSISLL